ncbi:tRNA intron endonuclease, catalytic C-terminal domain containing protein [Cladophialophora carrionii]|uniref:tRNA-intron lyase n=1 Tax=Cladophialophora carrionii TaxID=86049 RepID=A0A1C1CVR5_9EURO|nr:tRNA intron endonuclease, catalytic C-terminal domain containing protein [Cladophialophora carrionii]
MASAFEQPAPAEVPTSKPATTKPQRRPKRPNYNHIHRHLLPLEVYPLPVLIPHNPLSLVAIALSYLAQVIVPPRRPTYDGYFSSATSSIHVTDPDTIRRLWEMGFFGRGSLSRSEPNWLENRKKKGKTAEENTAARREQRRQLKHERARKEQEEIDHKLSEESQQGYPAFGQIVGTNGNVRPNKPEQNGRLNEHTDRTPDEQMSMSEPPQTTDINDHIHSISRLNVLKSNVQNISNIDGVLESASGTATPTPEDDKENGSIEGFEEWKKAIETNGLPTPPPTSTCSETSLVDARPVERLRRAKTVHFSPTVEAREFDLTSPVISPIKSPGTSPLEDAKPVPEVPLEQENQEHLSISLEEAFFLSYGLGVLNVYCDDSTTVLPPTSLLSLFRRHSYHPPRSLSLPAEPDDPFMISYAVYHHYRSLGWVVRSGVKFSTDYLLYNRGPAFYHAEFAVVIIPSYTHRYWTESTTAEERKVIERKTSKKNWWWLHGVNRVQAQVHKQLVLCYVDIPPPVKSEANDTAKAKDVDIGMLLSKYRIRDVNVRRWTPNRSRD